MGQDLAGDWDRVPILVSYKDVLASNETGHSVEATLGATLDSGNIASYQPGADPIVDGLGRPYQVGELVPVFLLGDGDQGPASLDIVTLRSGEYGGLSQETVQVKVKHSRIRIPEVRPLDPDSRLDFFWSFDQWLAATDHLYGARDTITAVSVGVLSGPLQVDQVDINQAVTLDSNGLSHRAASVIRAGILVDGAWTSGQLAQILITVTTANDRRRSMIATYRISEL